MKPYIIPPLRHGLVALLGLTLLACMLSQDMTLEGYEVFLVRHAEKANGVDPSLTPRGKARAEALARLLSDAGIEHIHSSDFKRTRETAAPLADALGLDVELYDASNLPAMAAKLQAEGGRHLVVGHSNTTPQLTELLGGDGSTPIVEATEYDRLYLVTRSQDGSISTVLLRYGN